MQFQTSKLTEKYVLFIYLFFLEKYIFKFIFPCRLNFTERLLKYKLDTDSKLMIFMLKCL